MYVTEANEGQEEANDVRSSQWRDGLHKFHYIEITSE
jgi:hypothetical protein